MGRSVAGLAKGMENVRCLFRNDALKCEAAKRVLERFALPEVQGVARGDTLGQ
jgi:hypothetical protein